jgi:hypothetical protein
MLRHACGFALANGPASVLELVSSVKGEYAKGIVPRAGQVSNRFFVIARFFKMPRQLHGHFAGVAGRGGVRIGHCVRIADPARRVER